MPNTKNFGYSTVLTAPSPASSGTSLVVQSADGLKFPSVPFNATVWPAGAQPLSTNAEIVTVTNISTDTLTITRQAESSSARSIIVGDQIDASITAGLFPAGTVVGTTDTQTLTNKIVSDTFMGDVYDNQSAIKESLTLPASTDVLIMQGIDISGANGLELPATSSMEISSFYDPSSVIPATRLSNPYKFSVYRAAALTSPSNASAILAFDTKNFDTSNNVDVVVNQGRFIAPVAGFYHFDAATGLNTTGADRVIISLFKNGVEVARGNDILGTVSNNVRVTVSSLLQLSAKDYIEISLFTSVAIAVDVSANYGTWFNGYLVSLT